MTQRRKTAVDMEGAGDAVVDLVGARAGMGGPTAGTADRPLTARSVVASTLLGTRPPVLPGRLLVRTGELFGIAEGTTRVALSRMAAAGEVEALGDGRYRLAGHLLARRVRQEQARRPRLREWDGAWRTAVVTTGGRSAPERTALRNVMRARLMGELREGVWLRPDNLDPPPPDAIDEHCTWFSARPEPTPGAGDRALAASLWDLDGWRSEAASLRQRMDATIGSLQAGDLEAVASCFVLAAAVQRRLTSDPLLPPELVPADWNADALRAAYDRYEAALQALLRHWFRSQPA
jgi:phenylacetic acid degradation operon negative regulatory protein